MDAIGVQAARQVRIGANDEHDTCPPRRRAHAPAVLQGVRRPKRSVNDPRSARHGLNRRRRIGRSPRVGEEE
jgi:hypothetical protein